MKRYLFLIFILCVALVYMIYSKTTQSIKPEFVTSQNNQNTQLEDKPQLPTSTSSLEDQNRLTNQVPNGKKNDIQNFLYNEASKVSQIDENPELSQARMLNQAQLLSDEDIKYLKTIIENSQINGDIRLVAIGLLSLSLNSKAHESLKDFAISNFSESKTQQHNQEEEIFRALATEGLADKNNSKKYLKEILKKSTRNLVKDRAQRTLLYEEKKAPKAEDQDKDALKKIIR